MDNKEFEICDICGIDFPVLENTCNISPEYLPGYCDDCLLDIWDEGYEDADYFDEMEDLAEDVESEDLDNWEDE